MFSNISKSLKWLGLFACLTPGLQAFEDDFFSLPSPSEILYEAESEGLSVKLQPRNVSVLQLDLDALATSDPDRTAFEMGRIFSVAGYGLKSLNNGVILQLAQKVLSAAKKLDLPEALSEEIDRFYRLMLSKTSWERNELMLSFTSARASLLYLLKDSGAVAPEDQARVGRLGVALECGLWFQSLDIAAQELEDKHLEAFNTVYLDPDYVDYFTRSLTRTKGSNHQLYKQLNTINMNCETAIVDERLSGDELKAIQASLSEVLN